MLESFLYIKNFKLDVNLMYTQNTTDSPGQTAPLAWSGASASTQDKQLGKDNYCFNRFIT
jgi:hypothetical protein